MTVPATGKYLFARWAFGAAIAIVPTASVIAAAIDVSLIIVLIIPPSLPMPFRLEIWGRGLKASAPPRAVDIFGRRAQSTSSAMRVVERIPQNSCGGSHILNCGIPPWAWGDQTWTRNEI